MCRLFAAMVDTRADQRDALIHAPRSLAALSEEHPHGWGVAVWSDAEGWSIEKSPVRAMDCARYRACAGRPGQLVLAHVRQRTVGPLAIENTHPFSLGRWVFAHNGTIEALPWLREQTCPLRRERLIGETDSELFFNYLLGALDRAGVLDAPADPRTDSALRDAVARCLAQERFGAINFVLTDGETLYAHRWGRTLFVSEVQGGALLASEGFGDHPWREVREGSLLRCDRSSPIRWRELATPCRPEATATLSPG